MARVLYFDCFSGISGDMALGALLDAGLPFDHLERSLGSLALSGYGIGATRVLRAGVSATKFTVHEQGHPHEPGHDHDHAHTHAPHQHAPGHAHPPGAHAAHDHATPDQSAAPHAHGHRSLEDIFALIDGASISQAARERAHAMFSRLAEAEATIHQMPVDRVHLHEVGALDSIIDIVGIVIALEWLGADEIICSPLNVGGGMVRSAHGLFPVPAPATVSLLGRAPIYSLGARHELVTPTGALIVSSYASSFGPIPPMTVERAGYGAGDRDDPETPNVLRVLIGHAAGRRATERVSVIECEMDDMSPQLFGVVMDQLYAAGAREVFYTPVQMKKNRPGTLLTVVTDPQRRPDMVDIIFRESTTIGLRHHDVDRECLDREIIAVETSVGPVRLKVASRDGHVLNVLPEFDDCVRAAAAHRVSVKDVQTLALRAHGDRQVRAL